MDYIEETVKYLAACQPETRDALIAVANAIPLAQNPVVDADADPAVKAVIRMRESSLQIASGLLSLLEKPKRGRPRGSRKKPAE